MGSFWDHIAQDPRTKLVVSMVQSRSRDQKSANRLLEDFASRTVKAPVLVLTDEHGPYKKALLSVYRVLYRPRRAAGEERLRPKKRRAPTGLVHATVKKTRRKGRVTEVTTTLSLGTAENLAAALDASPVSSTINTAFIERYNGTARHFNARKTRDTYSFSKALCEHQAMSWLMVTNYNLYWPHRSLRIEGETGARARRSPAMAAGLTDRLWTTLDLVTVRLLRATKILV